MYNLSPQPKQSHQHHHPLQKSHQTQLSFHHAGLPPHVILSHFHHPHMAIFAPARFCIYIYTRIALRAPRVAARARSSSSRLALLAVLPRAIYGGRARQSVTGQPRHTTHTRSREWQRLYTYPYIISFFLEWERRCIYKRFECCRKEHGPEGGRGRRLILRRGTDSVVGAHRFLWLVWERRAGEC